MYPFLSAIAVSFVVAAGIFALRRYAWDTAVRIGYVALACVGLLVVGGVALLVKSGFNRPDAATIAAVAVFYVVFGLALAALAATLEAILVSRSLDRPFGPSLVTAAIDPIVLGLILWWFLGSAAPLLYRTQVEAWQRREQDWKQQIDRLNAEIPEPYRNIPPEMIAEHSRWRAQIEEQGIPLSRLAPADVETKLLELQRLQQNRPRNNVTGGLHGFNSMRMKGVGGLAAGWIAGLAVGFLFFRVRETPAGSD